MIHRWMKTGALALSLAVALLGLLTTVGNGQEPPPSQDLCDPDPVRALHVALYDTVEGSTGYATVAVASAVSAYTYESGVMLEIHEIVDQPFPAELVTEGNLIRTDVQSPAACFPIRAWSDASVKVAIFVVSQGTVQTIGSWPIVSLNGTPLDGDSLTEDGATAELVALPSGETRALDEILDAARAYVEPTPTPFPEGVPTPNLTPPDAGPPPGGVTLPSTGDTRGGSTRWWVAGTVLAGLAGVVVIVSVAVHRATNPRGR